jgi:protein involved in temperature-dependent protein secretion
MKESFDPSKPKFAILRELMFRMHAVFGKYTQTQAHQKIVSVVERMVSLSSSLFSCLASAGFQSLTTPDHP